MLTRSLTTFVSLRSLLIQYKLTTSFLIRKESKEMIYASLMLGLILYNNIYYFLLKRKISKKLVYNIQHITLASLAYNTIIKHYCLASLGIIMITDINTLARFARHCSLYPHTIASLRSGLYSALDNAT